MGRHERFDRKARASARRSYPRLVAGLDLGRTARRGRRASRKWRPSFALTVSLAAAAMFAVVFAAPELIRLVTPLPITASSPGDARWTGRFGICRGPFRRNCVVDGDTFWTDGEKVRLAGIDTPELSPPRCAEEGRRGRAAKRRLYELLNSGTVELHVSGTRDRDRYGRLLRTATVDGRSVGRTMIAEGLAQIGRAHV